jgi:hypothetical protein
MVEIYIHIDNKKIHYKNGLIHRDNKPAIDNSKMINNILLEAWLQNGSYHRIDGPALIFKDGSKWWYYNDKRVRCNSQEEFERKIKLRLLW